MDSFQSAKDAKSAKDFDEFQGLMDELEAIETRPYAPDPANKFKQELRQQLLQDYEKQALSLGEKRRLWQFAGTAVALFLLVVAVGLFWAAISSRSPEVGPAADTVGVATRTAVPEMTLTPVPMSQTFTESDVVSWSNNPANVLFGDGIRLQQYDIADEDTSWQLTLHWQIQNSWPEAAQIFVNLVNEDGKLVRQIDTPLSKSEQDTILLAPLPGSSNAEDVLPDGRYDIIIGLYDPTTGQRLLVTADNERMVMDESTAVWLTDWQYSAKEDQIWLISASPEPGTNLFDTEGVPTTFTFEIGYHLVSAESAPIFWEMAPVGNGNLPRIVYYTEPWQDIAKGSGTVTAEIIMSSVRPEQLASAIRPHIWLSLPGRQITLPPSTLAETQWSLLPETNKPRIETAATVWLVSAIQKARPSASSPVEIEAEVGYELAAEEEVFLKLHYAAPDWETATDGRIPIDGLSEWIPLDPGKNSTTITFTGNPNEMTQIVGTTQPVLVAQLGVFVEGENGRELKLLSSQTFADMPFNLGDATEIHYGEKD